MAGKGKFKWAGICILFLAGAGIGCYLLCSTPTRMIEFARANGNDNQSFTYSNLDEVLGKYIDGDNMVDYEGLKENREKLDSFAASIGTLAVETYENDWSEKQKIAFWINAYNVLTLEAILEHYPIKASTLKSLVYPKNSIRQIPGVWDKLEFKVMGKKMTLNQIEHEVLRKKFNEPRIHVALVCAAMGCPPLRNAAYTGEKLDEQLDDQAEKFLVDSGKFKIDKEKNIVYFSSIFKWYGDDFVKTYGTEEKFKGHGDTVRALLNYTSKYLGEKDKKYLEEKEYSIEYLSYNWSLNEQKAKKEK